MQEYEAYQVGGEPVPIYNNMSGGYIVRDYQYLPAAVVCDIDGDGTAELVLCVKKASSVMCWCEVYELDGEVPEKTLHAAVN